MAHIIRNSTLRSIPQCNLLSIAYVSIRSPFTCIHGNPRCGEPHETKNGVALIVVVGVVAVIVVVVSAVVVVIVVMLCLWLFCSSSCRWYVF